MDGFKQDKIRKTGFGELKRSTAVDVAFQKGYPGQRAPGFPMPEGNGAGGKSTLIFIFTFVIVLLYRLLSYHHYHHHLAPQGALEGLAF